MNKKGSQFWPNFVQVVSFKYEEQRKQADGSMEKGNKPK